MENLSQDEYADDTVILAGTLAHLQRTMNMINSTCNKYGLELLKNVLKN